MERWTKLYLKFDRLIKTVYNDGTELRYEHNAEGSSAKLTHQKGSTTLGVYTSEYDSNEQWRFGIPIYNSHLMDVIV